MPPLQPNVVDRLRAETEARIAHPASDPPPPVGTRGPLDPARPRAVDAARGARETRLRGLVDLDALPLAARRLLVDQRTPMPTVGVLDRDLRTVVLALRRRGVEPEQVAHVIGTSALADAVRMLGGDVELTTAEALTHADRDLERQSRPGENFSVRAVERIEHAAAPSFLLGIERDDQPGELWRVEARWGDLESYWRFQSRCVREIGFMPTLKPQYRGERFGSFAARIVNQTHPPVSKPRHGSLHGGTRKTVETSDLLVDCLRAFVQAQGGEWEGSVPDAYQAACDQARQRGPLPLDWPQTVNAFGWRCRTVGPEGFLRAGVEWRRHQKNGWYRAWRYALRLVVAQGSAGTAA